MSANPERGEVEVILDDAYAMRPSFEAQQAIERQTGVSMDEFYVRAMRFAQGITGGLQGAGPIGFKLDELVVIVTEGVKAARKDRGEQPLADWKPARVAELIVQNRMRVIDAVGIFVLNALSGGSEKKAEPPAASG